MAVHAYPCPVRHQPDEQVFGYQNKILSVSSISMPSKSKNFSSIRSYPDLQSFPYSGRVMCHQARNSRLDSDCNVPPPNPGARIGPLFLGLRDGRFDWSTRSLLCYLSLWLQTLELLLSPVLSVIHMFCLSLSLSCSRTRNASLVGFAVPNFVCRRHVSLEMRKKSNDP
jgi:hypothetical protein